MLKKTIVLSGMVVGFADAPKSPRGAAIISSAITTTRGVLRIT